MLNIVFCENGVEVVDIFKPKKQTPSSLIPETLSKPDIEKVYKGNDLTRRAGSFDVAVGELLYLKGKITDAFGVPISNALVIIWHTNSAGKNQNILKSNNIYIDDYFVVSGMAKTDNLGHYGFKTIFPGYESDTRAPHINITIMHTNFETIDTEIYFKNHYMNIKDPIYMSYPDEDRNMLTASVKNIVSSNSSEGKIAIFNIVMDGIHSYKKY
jgi:protocatechuate 3,4-dioxygenase beta subunit